MFDIVDEELQTRWLIWPFVWAICGNGDGEGEAGDGREDERSRRLQALVKLGWEHTEVRFVVPEEVDRMQTVPYLGRNLRRVLSGGDDSRGGD